jgi:hypothetical protein
LLSPAVRAPSHAAATVLELIEPIDMLPPGVRPTPLTFGPARGI